MQGKRFLTLEETAEYTGLSLHYIYSLSSQNKLPGKITWGKRTVRVDRLILNSELEKRTAGIAGMAIDG